MITEIALIVVSAVLINHLGLIEAIEKVIRHKLPIVNCCKCLSFWSVLVYSLFSIDIITSLAISFVSAYLAIWLELLCGFIDTLYNRCYENLYTKKTETKSGAKSRMSELQNRKKK